MSIDWLSEVAEAVGPVAQDRLLSQGCLGPVHWFETVGGRRLVAKIDEAATGTLEVEARMLEFLRDHTDLIVPEPVYANARVLVMTHLTGQPGCNVMAEAEAGVQLARLHAITNERCGFEFETRIGGLAQPNPWSDAWIPFFAEHRLVHMARCAFDMGRIRRRQLMAVERIAKTLEDRLEEPRRSALLHGDLWSGNVLSHGNAVVGFIDPALYFGHPEVELAFVTLFSTFGDTFFRSYQAMTGRPLDVEFWNERRNVYNIYPLLVHVCLVGGSYVGDLNEMLDRYA